MATAPQQQAAPLTSRLAMIAQSLESRFLGKEEVIRLLLIATVAGEHAVLIGPPGTAKSALIRTFAKLLQARYFEYLLTRFTEPNEIFGPVDIAAFREGRYVRRIEGMLPDSEIVFLDEVFKSNSAILNALLTLLNERKYTSGGQVLKVPDPLVLRRVERGPERRDAHGDLRPLPPPHSERQPRRVPLPGSPPEGPPERGHGHGGRARRAARERARDRRAPPRVLAADEVLRGVLLAVQGPRLPDPRRGRSASAIAAS